jgi:hypothetical protein
MSKTLKELDLVIVEVHGLELDHLVFYGNSLSDEDLVDIVETMYGDEVEIANILR